jgi:drug/metabolite transporter (DMT)-like permease
VTAAVIISSMPLVSAMLGWLTGRERITAALLVALVLVVTGGIMTSAAPAGDGSASSPLGAGLMFVATLLYLWYTRLMVEDFAAVPVLAKTAASTIVGALLAALAAGASVLFGVVAPEYDLSASTVGLLVWLGLAVGFSAVLWFWVSGKIGVTVAAMHNNLVPFYVILLGAAIGSAVGGQQLVGALLVIAGTAIVQIPASLWRSRTEGA